MTISLNFPSDSFKTAVPPGTHTSMHAPTHAHIPTHMHAHKHTNKGSYSQNKRVYQKKKRHTGTESIIEEQCLHTVSAV